MFYGLHKKESKEKPIIHFLEYHKVKRSKNFRVRSTYSVNDGNDADHGMR